MRPLQPGDPEYIEEYTLESRLGEGAMGVVYKAWNQAGLPVAIKVIAPKFSMAPKYRERFETEAAAAQLVPRFCTAQVIDASPGTDPPYIVTEYIPGPPLSEVVIESPLHGAQVDSLAVGIAAALRAIHAAGVIHRDLKPANILMSPYGPRVIDFGLAALVGSTRRLTSSGNAVGTLAYMAPEQADGEPATNKADIYSWGATVVFAATGRPPRVPYSRGLRVRNDLQPEVLGLTGSVYETVLQALQAEPDARPTAEEVLGQLATLSPAVLADAASIDSRPRRRGSPRNADQWARSAVQSLANEKPRLALFEAEQGISADSSNAKCWFYKGVAQIRLGYREQGEDSMRLAYEMDPSDPDISTGYLMELVESPRGESKAIAFSIAPKIDRVKQAYLQHLLAEGGEDVLAEIATGSRDPHVLHAYAQSVMRQLESANLEAIRARNEAREEASKVRELSFRRPLPAGEIEDAEAKEKQAERRAEEAMNRAHQLAARAYIVLPEHEGIKRAYAMSLLRDGDIDDVAHGYRLARDDREFVEGMLRRLIERHSPYEVRRLLRSVDSTVDETELLALQLTRVVGNHLPTIGQWTSDPAWMTRRASVIELLAAHCMKRLEGVANPKRGTIVQLQYMYYMAFASADDDLAHRGLAIVGRAALLAILGYSVLATWVPLLPWNAMLVSAVIVGLLLMSFASRFRLTGSAVRERRRRRMLARAVPEPSPADSNVQIAESVSIDRNRMESERRLVVDVEPLAEDADSP